MKILAGLALAAAAGSAQAEFETAQFGNAYTIDARTGTMVASSGFGSRATAIYSNTASPANFGVSSNSLGAIWGDEMTTVGTGTLDELQFGVFNSTSGGNVGAFQNATATINFYRSVDGSSLGGFNVTLANVGLAAGFYTIFTVTNLSGLGVNLDTTGIIMTQQLSGVTGGTNRMGVVSLQPVTIGSTGTSLYVSGAANVGGGAAGYYNFGNPILNGALAAQISIPAPSAMALLGLGGLVATRRRR